MENITAQRCAGVCWSCGCEVAVLHRWRCAAQSRVAGVVQALLSHVWIPLPPHPLEGLKLYGDYCALSLLSYHLPIRWDMVVLGLGVPTTLVAFDASHVGG